VDRVQLAEFLRTRRERLQPADVGLARGARRRATGLRREEVAALANMSTDYYARLEQQRGPQPSEQILDAIARALRLSRAERDHLIRLAGWVPASPGRRSAHVSPALLHVLDNLDVPAQVISDLGQTLVQNAAAVALLGDETRFTGGARAVAYRWFTDPGERRRVPYEDWQRHSRNYVVALRRTLARNGQDPEIRDLLAGLRTESPEFVAIWDRHDVDGDLMDETKRFLHPEVGTITVDCQVLVAENQAQALLIFTAAPGSEDHDKLKLLAVIGKQELGCSAVDIAGG
jgi:transcriptional regulator with XRE-family HTH domain